MRNDLKSLYTATLENAVIVFDTNLTEFIEKLRKLEPGIRNYDYFYREFKKSAMVKMVTETGQEYSLQKVL